MRPGSPGTRPVGSGLLHERLAPPTDGGVMGTTPLPAPWKQRRGSRALEAALRRPGGHSAGGGNQAPSHPPPGKTDALGRCITLDYKVRLLQATPSSGRPDLDRGRRPMPPGGAGRRRAAPVGQDPTGVAAGSGRGRHSPLFVAARWGHCRLQAAGTPTPCPSSRYSPLAEMNGPPPRPPRRYLGTDRVGRGDQIIRGRPRPCTPWWRPTPHWCQWRWWLSPCTCRSFRPPVPPP